MIDLNKNTTASNTSWRELAFPLTPPQTKPVWRWLAAWLLAGYVLRAMVALAGDFVLHPDEIMQYLEPAHSVVFGSGILHWEYFYGARSWLVPGFVAMWLWLCAAVGLGEPWFYVNFVKLIFCALSLLVPWGLYHYTRYRFSESAGRLVLALTCLWPYISVYAHKPFTEFVATSLLCGVLGLAAAPAAHRTTFVAAIGFLLTLVALVRFQYAPVAGIIWLAFAMSVPRRILWLLIAASITALVFVGAIETYTWGSPFRSYWVNLIFNIELNTLVVRLEPSFFVLRLLYISAGTALLTMWAIFQRPRAYALLGVILLVALLSHQFNAHKEMRFLYVMVPLMLVPVAVWLVEFGKTHKFRQPQLFASATALAAMFQLLMVCNLLPYNKWLNVGTSNERGELHYLFGHSNLWRIYRKLARLDDVQAVLHLGDFYFNTPGYYYLHQNVPFYDNYLFNVLQKNVQQPLTRIVTHVVTRKRTPLPGFVSVLDTGEYRLLARAQDDGPVLGWHNYITYVIGGLERKIASQRLNDLRQVPGIVLSYSKLKNDGN